MTTDRDELEAAKATITRLTAQRDQALARAAAAAMEMREQAAELVKDHFPGTVYASSRTKCLHALLALPIDPDAQKALDQLLAKARGDALREAAAVSGHYLTTEADELLADMWREDILSLLNDGGRDE